MNRTFLYNLSLIVLIAISLLSCSKNDDNIEPTNFYYIKYEVSSSSKESNNIVGGGLPFNQSFIFTTERGTDTIIKQGGSAYLWEGTYGPFKKGEKVSLLVSFAKKNYAKISACRNEEPFVIKKEEEVKNSEISLSYTIDF